MLGQRGAVGVYTHSTQIPPCDNSEAKRVLTVDMGIHRHAIFKVAGKVVGEVSATLPTPPRIHGKVLDDAGLIRASRPVVV